MVQVCPAQLWQTQLGQMPVGMGLVCSAVALHWAHATNRSGTLSGGYTLIEATAATERQILTAQAAGHTIAGSSQFDAIAQVEGACAEGQDSMVACLRSLWRRSPLGRVLEQHWRREVPGAEGPVERGGWR
jgi:hypothetical protein